nr:hypothetical protein MACL_00003670 [Theileria orientalis]
MQFKAEFDEIFVNTPLATEGNLRGINSGSTENDQNSENKHEKQKSEQTVGSNEAGTDLFSGKSLDHRDSVAKPAVIKSYAYRPRDQYREIGLIKGRRNGDASRPRIRNKWAGTVLDPLSPFGVGDGKFLQFKGNGGLLNKRLQNTNKNNFLQYNLTGDGMDKRGINGSFNAYRAEDTITKVESVKLTIYISVFAGAFFGTILVVWLIGIMLSAGSKRKSKKGRSGESADDGAMSEVNAEGDLCLAESRASNPSLLKIDYYISAENNLGSALSDIDESDEDSDEDEDTAINRLKSIFDVGPEEDDEEYDEQSPLLHEGHQNNGNSAAAAIGGNAVSPSAATDNAGSADPTPTVNLGHQKDVFI